MIDLWVMARMADIAMNVGRWGVLKRRRVNERKRREEGKKKKSRRGGGKNK